MSIKFSDSINKSGLVELIDDMCHSNQVSYPILNKTRDINIALDEVLSIIFKVGGKWQFDDSNHIDYPFIKTDIIANQRDYAFTTDEQGNLILDIYKVMVIDPNTGLYVELNPVDQQSDSDMQSFYDGQNLTGMPTRYDKTGNSIFLDCIPNINITGGLKIFINREGSYFTASDTTKIAGFDGLYHKYLALRPSIDYCMRNQKFNLSDRYEIERQKMEINIKKAYRDRSKDEVPQITSEQVDSV